MGKNSGISYVDHSINFWIGCTKVSAGCDNCYMYAGQKMYGNDPTVVKRTSPGIWRQPFVRSRGTKQHKWKDGQRVFVCSWSDFFHTDADVWREDAWSVIRRRPDLHWVIVTKRIHDVAERLPEDFTEEIYPNITILATTENQAMADERIHVLIHYKEVYPFIKIGISAEPLLGPLLLIQWLEYLDAVIIGAENAPVNVVRICKKEWINDILKQCKEAKCPVLVKQWHENGRLVRNSHGWPS